MLYLVYSLMLICSLVMVLYAAALGVKLSARLKNPLSKAVLALLIPAGAALPGAVLSMLARNVCDPYFVNACSPETGGVVLTWVYRASLGWTAAAFLGGLVVLAMGFQNRGWTPASSDWHVEGLFFRAVVAAVLTVALFFGADNLVTRELKSELAWYQKLHEWSEPLPPEGGEKGRQEYIAAYTAMQNIFGTSVEEEKALPEWWDAAFKIGGVFNAGSPEVRRFLWDNKDTYALIANAASAPALDMSWDDLFSSGSVNPKNMAKMLNLSSRVNAGRGWFVSAMRDIRNILKIEEHLKASLGLDGYLYGILLRSYALVALEETVAKAGFYGVDPVHYPDLNDIFRASEFMKHMRRNYTQAMAEFLTLLASPAVKEENQTERFKKILYRVFMVRHALGCVKTAYDAEEAALAEGYFSSAKLEDNLGDCKPYKRDYSYLKTKAYRLSTLSRGAELTMATVKYYRRHQRYPVDIFKLAPDFIESIPADPFDDSGTMVMASDDGALLFYSPAYERAEGQRIGFRLKKQ